MVANIVPALAVKNNTQKKNLKKIQKSRHREKAQRKKMNVKNEQKIEKYLEKKSRDLKQIVMRPKWVNNIIN